MDKIQEKHHKTVESWDTIDGVFEGQSKDHASITEDMMGRFAEWVNKEGWEYYRVMNVWHNYPDSKSTSELIQLFKETL